jgi:hypothetical protein
LLAVVQSKVDCGLIAISVMFLDVSEVPIALSAN